MPFSHLHTYLAKPQTWLSSPIYLLYTCSWNVAEGKNKTMISGLTLNSWPLRPSGSLMLPAIPHFSHSLTRPLHVFPLSSQSFLVDLYSYFTEKTDITKGLSPGSQQTYLSQYSLILTFVVTRDKLLRAMVNLSPLRQQTPFLLAY